MEAVSDADGRTDGYPDGCSRASCRYNSVARVSGRTGEDAYLVEGRTVPVGHGMGMIKDARGRCSVKTHGTSSGLRSNHSPPLTGPVAADGVQRSPDMTGNGEEACCGQLWVER